MTAQFPERLRFDGQDRALLSLPLEKYLGHLDRQPPWPDGGTALRRGYVGRWEIVADRLYLVGLTTVGCGVFPLETLFPGFPERVFAHWYSGELRVPMGARLRYVHQGFQSIYERELFLAVRRGVVTGRRQIEPELPQGDREKKFWR